MSVHQSVQSAFRTQYYERDVDFAALARKDADWDAVYSQGESAQRLDFRDPSLLSKTILKCDFGILHFDVPPDRLCPPVPVRWNYVRWIQELLDTTSETHTDSYDPSRVVTGLDIGVGASAIYPLLACSARPKWCMAGTDIDAHSLSFAKTNVTSNGLQGSIRLLQTSSEQPLVPLEEIGIEELDFVMTNPPFYDSAEDMQRSMNAKATTSSAICTGSQNEMIYPGGDEAFVSRLLDESLSTRKSVKWYTAMLGKLASLQQIITKLKALDINNIAVTRLQAGSKTNRWAVAWSFHNRRPSNAVTRHGMLTLDILPPPTEQTIHMPLIDTVSIGEKVDNTLKTLNARWSWNSDRNDGILEADENVWSRAARRKQKFANVEVNPMLKNETVKNERNENGSEEDSDERVALAVKISCQNEAVMVRWLCGHERVVFESFCGMLKRALVTPRRETS